MKIVVSDANLSSWRDDLEAALPTGTVVAWPDPTDDAEIQEALMDADVLVGPRYTADMAGAGKKLRLVQVAGAGTDKIEVDALPAGHAGGQYLSPRGFDRRVRGRRDGAAASRDPPPGRRTSPWRVGISRPQPS